MKINKKANNKTNTLKTEYEHFIKNNKDFISETYDPETHWNVFYTYLLNFPKDANWIYHLRDFDSNFVKTDFPKINEKNAKNYPELISVNLIEREIDVESKDKKYSVNFIVNCKASKDKESLSLLITSYHKLVKKITEKDFDYIENNYGESFLGNLKNILQTVDGNNYSEVIDASLTTLNFINIEKWIIDEKNKEIDQTETNIHVVLYTEDDLLKLFDTCKSFSWPYVNTTEELELLPTSSGSGGYICVSSDEDITGYACNIMASSIKRLYGTYGVALFSSNIRYFTKTGKGAKDVNNDITKQLKDNPEEFWFKNNGITIISSVTDFGKNTAKIDKFSIVNGGQTTHLIGNATFKDFPILCKIINIDIDISDELKSKDKEKYNANLNKWFAKTSEIAFALNSQKPVLKKDLMTNDERVRKLKKWFRNQFDGDKSKNAFLLTKNGEEGFYMEKSNMVKIEKYFQLLSAFFIQQPGFAKNQKAKFYNELWKDIYLGKRDSEDAIKFVNGIQLLQLARAEKVISSRVKSMMATFRSNNPGYNENNQEFIKLQLLGHATLTILAIIGVTWQDNHSHSFEGKTIYARNFFKEHCHVDCSIETKTNIFTSFEREHFDVFLSWVGNFLLEKFTECKDNNLGLDYRKFTINDDFYFDFVCKSVLTKIKENKIQWNRHFSEIIEII